MGSLADLNSDVPITIAFAGLVISIALVAVWFTVPRARRETAGVERQESTREPRDAAVH